MRWWEQLILIAAILTAILTIVKSPVVGWLTRKLFLDPVKDAVEEVVDKQLEIRLIPITINLETTKLAVHRIEAELHPNGGSSIKDSLNRIEEGVVNDPSPKGSKNTSSSKSRRRNS